MRKEYIMSEEDKVLKRQKIEQNRAKKRPNPGDSKVTKMKRESVEESNFDNDTSVSIASVVSTASTMSETYFWESDRKYTDLDSNRLTVIDNMSPVTAASVPSPSSPPQNSDIAGSKTLEMLRESNSVMNFYSNEIMESGSPSKRIYTNSDIISSDNKSSVERNIEDESGPSNFESLRDRFKENFAEKSSLAYQRIEPNFEKRTPYEESVLRGRPVSEACFNSGTAEETVCFKPKESCAKGSNLAMKIAQDPELVAKMVNNPLLLARIFENQDVLMKIMMDPQTISKLTADPSISEFLEQNVVDAGDRNGERERSSKEGFQDQLKNDRGSDQLNRHVLEMQHCQVENPILTNLITNPGSDEAKLETAEPSTSDWNKTADDVTRDVLQDVQRLPITPNSIESILCEAIKLEFSAFSSLGNNLNSRELNDSERAKLNELIVANKALHAPLDDDITNLIGDECKFKGSGIQSDPMLLDVINLTAIAIRRLIKMSKKINAFKNMCQEDQLALLKGGCTEMMILRSAINYDPRNHVWKIPHTQERMSNIKVDVLKEAKGNLYAEHAKFVRTFDPRWRDENIILILSAIALFTPDRSKVVHSDVIKLEQNSYYYLLRRYLESMYSGCEAKSTFLKLIQKISELHRLNEEVVGVYLNVNPSSVEPLLIEIFDLKH
ncbi:uncharacterized protein LOC117174222 isoform X3 [Belonocnema kinseyi]|nr:uncharacterized protein LOC117174222 isoform X3 [Belonocnema kinseyi]